MISLLLRHAVTHLVDISPRVAARNHTRGSRLPDRFIYEHDILDLALFLHLGKQFAQDNGVLDGLCGSLFTSAESLYQ